METSPLDQGQQLVGPMRCLLEAGRKVFLMDQVSSASPYGVCFEYSVSHCVQYSLQCSVQNREQYIVFFTVQSKKSGTIQRRQEGGSTRNQIAHPPTLISGCSLLLGTVYSTVQYRTHWVVTSQPVKTKFVLVTFNSGDHSGASRTHTLCVCVALL